MLNALNFESPFLNKSRWIFEGKLAVCVDQKGYEVSPAHCLVVPKRPVPSVWLMTPEEWSECFFILEVMKDRINISHKPDGYNIGVNDGEAAGQTIPHAHFHLIPRYKGDHPNPRGGVRAVIPGKADWTKNE